MPPTRLLQPYSNRRRQLISKDLAAGVVPVRSVRAIAPWPGYTPDLPPDRTSFAHARELIGLRPRANPAGFGEILTADNGWAQFDPARLPLGGISTRAVHHLTQLNRTTSAGATTGDFDVTPIAALAGDGAAADSHQLHRIQPSTSQWQKIAYSGAGVGAMLADRDGFSVAKSLPQSCIFHGGAPVRGVLSGAIAEPCLIYTNNVDRVMVYPAGTGLHTYEELTNVAALAPFIARSVTSFYGRVFFLNTSEASVRRRTRLRWSPVFTANPDPAVAVGGGTADFNEFNGQGQRVLPIGLALAVYFEDGVVFARPTEIPTFPLRFEIVSSERGLLSGTGVCSIQGRLHFGIFNDGWFFLDAGGNFTEAGVTEFDGVTVRKWKDTFYSLLDTEQRHRLVTYYDAAENVIRISVPVKGQTELQQYWVYDIVADRISIEEAECVSWGSYQEQVAAGVTWGGTNPVTWGAIVGSWGSFATQFGLEATVHGDAHGNVYIHSQDFITREQADNSVVFPTYKFASHRLTSGRPSQLATLDRVTTEYVRTTGPNGVIRAQSSKREVSGTLRLDEGDPAEINTSSNMLHFTDQEVGFQVTGMHPTIIRSFDVDVRSSMSTDKD